MLKGGILCIGGFRGRARGGQNRNLVTLENNRTLVQQLNLQVASCDSYWIGSMPGEAHSRQNTARTMHLLVLLLATGLSNSRTLRSICRRVSKVHRKSGVFYYNRY